MRLFTDVLRDIKRGAVVDEATQALVDVANAVRRSKRKGSVTITLTMTPDKGDEDVVEVEASVGVKQPRVQQQGKAVFYLDKEGTLMRSDPRQVEMPLAEVRGSGGGTHTRAAVVPAGWDSRSEPMVAGGQGAPGYSAGSGPKIVD